MNKDERFLKIATYQARASNDNFRVGAVVVKSSSLISAGYNQGWKTHPKAAEMYPDRVGKGLHAEMHALVGLRPYDTKGGLIYVVRLKKDDSWGLARPCPECLEELYRYEFKKMIYSNTKNSYVVERL